MGSWMSCASGKDSVSRVDWPVFQAPNEIPDDEALALIENLDYEKNRLGDWSDPIFHPNAWRINSDTVLKRTIPLDYVSTYEPYLMMLVSSQTTIPVPRLRKYVLHESELWIFMEYIEGRTLEEAWDTLSITMKLWVAWTLRGYIRQLRLIPIPTPRVPGPTDGSGKPLRCKGHFFPEIGAGPFASYADLSAWYTRRADRAVRLDYEWSKYRGKTPSLSHSSLHFDDSEPLVLTHGDISLRNIILGKDGRLWLIDWGWAGVYPQWLEYGSMMMYTERSGLKPRLWFWLLPFMAGWYRSQYRFLRALDHALTFYD